MTSALPGITAVIPAYKAAATIERAVRSMLGQPGIDAQVVVIVDDEEGSSERVLAPLASDRVRVLPNDRNRGAQYSRNRGLALVETPYVMFLDSDDFVMGDLLAGLAARLEAGADVAFGPWLWYDEGANLSRRRAETYADTADLLTKWMLERRWTPPCAILWRTDFVRRIGGWDEVIKRNQDGELVCRGALAGARLGASAIGSGVYYQHESEHRITANAKTHDSLELVAEKLLERGSEAIAPETLRGIIGEYFYRLADVAFRRQDRETGRRALARARALGATGQASSRFIRLGSALLGLEGYHRMRRLLGKRS